MLLIFPLLLILISNPSLPLRMMIEKQKRKTNPWAGACRLRRRWNRREKNMENYNGVICCHKTQQFYSMLTLDCELSSVFFFGIVTCNTPFSYFALIAPASTDSGSLTDLEKELCTLSSLRILIIFLSQFTCLM